MQPWCEMQLVLLMALTMAQPTYKDTDNGIEIEHSVGDTFTVRLTSNPSTGYQWLFDGGTDFTHIGQSQYEDVPRSPMRIGAPVTQVMQFKALKQGKHTLTLYYTRIWDRKSSDKTYKLVINVK